MAFSICKGVREPSELADIVAEAFPDGVPVVRNNKRECYINAPFAFDIETSSFLSNQSEKRGIMYAWVLGVNGRVVLGRTWQEFGETLRELVKLLEVNDHRRLILWVHNLAYEFQFICGREKWGKVFSLRERKPLYARTENGIEFRCSYLLSGYSLAMVGKMLRNYKVEKLVGELDYSKIRHHLTPLTDAEKAYCINDALVVMAYIQERIEEDGDITRIPLTKTGYVRTHCRNACLHGGEGGRKKPEAKNKYFRYRSIMNRLQIDQEEYRQLKRAFQGGFTHASAWKSGKVMENVTSYDFTSSYPAVMVSEKFPMSSAERVDIRSIAELERNVEKYCCLFDVEFIGLCDRDINEHYISVSRCWGVSGAVVDNGRIVSADRLCTTITEQDYLIIRHYYTWDKMGVRDFRRYRRGYLPAPFVSSILDMYRGKTELKGVEGREAEYAKSKEMINSCYGMTVTDICRDEIIFNTEGWSQKTPDIGEALAKYNTSKNRFLFYPWGVWITAYARRNLFTGIAEFGNDYIYSDTDSIKAINAGDHAEYIEKYNKMVSEKIKAALEYHGLPLDAAEPSTIKGVKKPLGVWDFDGQYSRFKTLGAKRYLVEQDGELKLTVAGLSKRDAVEYLEEQSQGDNTKAFELFSENWYVPPGRTGKNTHTYIDHETEGEVTDYMGVKAHYHEYSSIHMGPADYSLSLSRAYADYLRGLVTQYD